MLIKQQIEKWGKIQTRRSEEQKIHQNIVDLEKKLGEATHNEDYDLATEIQTQIDKLIASKPTETDHPFDIQSQIKLHQTEFLSQLKDDIYKLIEVESKLTTDKNIFEKSETEKISYAKEDLTSKSNRCTQTASDLSEKLSETEDKLNKIEQKAYEHSKEHVDERNHLDSEIKIVDKEIEELEKQLKLKIDKKHDLEERREQKVKIIKKLNEEFEGEIEELSDIKEKYQRKQMVNDETKEVLKEEDIKIKEEEKEFEKKLVEFDTQIQ
jgi:hypothetical protein